MRASVFLQRKATVAQAAPRMERSVSFNNLIKQSYHKESLVFTFIIYILRKTILNVISLKVLNIP